MFMHVSFFRPFSEIHLYWISLGEDRFLNFYGQYGARISGKQTIHQAADSNKHHSYVIKIVSPSLFCAPDVHLKAMKDLWVDELTVKWRWAEFFNKLNEEWRGHIVYVSPSINSQPENSRKLLDRQVFCSMLH